MPSDVEIAQSATPLPIERIAESLGVPQSSLRLYGGDVAKLSLGLLDTPRKRKQPGRLILVSAITPTPAGEGKTTTSIGLAQGMARIGQSTCLALREPSMGPVFGVKGGATGGGYSQLLPMERLNLHFTGDFHAITSAHNLLAALLDNHLHQGNALDLDPRRVLWRRVIDMNDRALRRVIVGLGGPKQGVPRETGFDITAASEVMAMLCLAEGPDDLRERLGRTLVGFTRGGDPVRADQLGATGSMLALLQDALEPNLVQTLEGTPALVHGGPFANIAHGCNSVLATRMALHLSDWAITEAGFGFDLGAEKFFDIKCRSAGLDTAAVVLVATIRALKLHGGIPLGDVGKTDPAAVERGLPNLEKHIESIRTFGETPVVAINRFADDSEEEVEIVRRACETLGAPCAVADHHARGGAGAEDLARTLIAHADARGTPFHPLYALDSPVPEKIAAVAICGRSSAWAMRNFPFVSPRCRAPSATIPGCGDVRVTSTSPYASCRSTPAPAFWSS
jgi:formate--tetrahydrofolate ligase